MTIKVFKSESLMCTLLQTQIVQLVLIECKGTIMNFVLNIMTFIDGKNKDDNRKI